MKSVNYVFGGYFIISMLYILYTFFPTGSHISASRTLVKRDELEEKEVSTETASTGTVTAGTTSSSTTTLSPKATYSATATATASSTSYKLRVQSWNIRSAFLLKKYVPIETTTKALNAEDGTPTTDKNTNYYWNWRENAWTARRIGLTQYVKFYQPDIFAVEEALDMQIKDLAVLLPDYDWIGVGRTDNKTRGEYEAIFYNTKTVKLESWDTFWLSETPFEPSLSKCAGSTRDATVSQFRTISKNLPFTVINTHWDDKCNAARKLAASLIKHRAAFEFENNKAPVILTGDFNSEAYGISNGGYEIITGKAKALDINEEFAKKYNCSISDNFNFVDTYFATSPENRLGNFATFTGFYKAPDYSRFTRIDFQMTGQVTNNKSNAGISSIRYHVPDMFSDSGFHLSDHRAVISDYKLIKQLA